MRVIIRDTTVTPPRAPRSLSWMQSDLNDEGGYHAEEFRVWLGDDDLAYMDTESRGRDCDGEHASYRSYIWDPLTGKWEYLDGSEYDQFAQLMNY